MSIILMESFKNYFLYNRTPVLFFCKSVIKIILAPSPVVLLVFSKPPKAGRKSTFIDRSKTAEGESKYYVNYRLTKEKNWSSIK